MCVLRKILRIAVLAAVLIPPMACSSEGNDTNMIVGGFKVHIEDVPYQAALFYRGILLCGGSIIGPQWIITSYHCVDSLDPARYEIVVGSDDPRSGKRLKVKKVIVPPELFESSNLVYDIGLLLLQEPLTFSKNVQCLQLLSSVDALVPGKPGYISGYGTSFEGGHDSTLKAATINLLPASTCVKAYEELMRQYMICAGFEEGMVDSCQGDSGGPLVVDGKLAGIIFYGRGCARPNNPGIYMSIPWFRDWIVNSIHVEGSPAERTLCGEN
ncbi:trypsin 3A1-like [Anopheles funestus]|uniref:trypsin 3A1-like n=1 Tax=Anopheles funestus TaxID=62324 RepID=UPI0020C6AF56|nr:trypsin 3A1-like [Anopheles funestus]